MVPWLVVRVGFAAFGLYLLGGMAPRLLRLGEGLGSVERLFLMGGTIAAFSLYAAMGVFIAFGTFAVRWRRT